MTMTPISTMTCAVRDARDVLTLGVAVLFGRLRLERASRRLITTLVVRVVERMKMERRTPRVVSLLS